MRSEMSPSKVTVVLGSQWGDEGKGKLVDLLATSMDIVCRYNGGNNAGHTIVVGSQEFAFHLLPSGLINPKCMCVIGNGVVVHLPSLFEELKLNESMGLSWWKDRLLISDRAHLVFDLHLEVDKLQEEEKGLQSIGTTKKGIGPTYSSKASRNGIRLGDLLGNFDSFKEKYKNLVSSFQQMYPSLKVDFDKEMDTYFALAKRVRPLVTDTVTYIHNALADGKSTLVEGANALLLDIDFGTYPFVTSSNCSIGGVCTGLGVPPKLIGDVYGVVKAYTTRVGDGPFPTEAKNKYGDMLQSRGREVGVTTKRKRRCGWLDIPLLQYSNKVNGYTAIAITKLDILDTFPEIKVAVSYKLHGKRIDYFPANCADLAEVEPEYITIPGWECNIEAVRKMEDLPINARKYLLLIEEYLTVPIRWIGIGPARDAVITRF